MSVLCWCQIAKTREGSGQKVQENLKTVGGGGGCVKISKSVGNSLFLSQDLVRRRPKRGLSRCAAYHKTKAYLNIIFKEKHDDI